MPPHVSSTRPRAAPYRLRTPPARHWAPVVVVARGRRFQVGLGQKERFIKTPSSSPTLTEPLSSPSRPAGNQALSRTYSFTEPHYRDLVGCSAGADATAEELLGTPSVPAAVTSPAVDNLEPVTTIVGLQEIGVGLFRPADHIALQIPTFDVPMSFEDFIRLRLQLDSADGGLTPAQFREMIGGCRGCERFMLMRSKDHHRCRGKSALPTLVPEKRLLLLANTTSGGQGLTINQFRHLFVVCPLCDLVFTRSAASRHFHDDDSNIGSDVEVAEDFE